MFPDDSGKVEHGSLEEENEDHPLVVLVVDHLLTRLKRSNSRMRIVLGNLMRISFTILITNLSPPRDLSLKLCISENGMGELYQ